MDRTTSNGQPADERPGRTDIVEIVRGSGECFRETTHCLIPTRRRPGASPCRNVATTTGITASMPMSLTLIEAIAGRPRAEAVARELGLARWDASHDSGAFILTRTFVLTVLGNVLAFWNREELGVEVSPGIDEVSLVLVADAWSRTYRSRAVTFARTAGAVESRNGIRIIPDRALTSWPTERVLPAVGLRKPAEALHGALSAIRERYGNKTAWIVAMQLEYPQHDVR